MSPTNLNADDSLGDDGSNLINDPLARWRAKLSYDPGNAKIALVGDSTSDAATNALAMYNRLRNLHTQAGEALDGVASANIVNGGNNGVPLIDWFSNPASGNPFNRDALQAASPDLIVYSWLLNDVRVGLLGTTVDAIVPKGIVRLRSLIEWTRRALPSADILLRMPSSILTANVSGLNFVTDGSTVNPTGIAQIYTTAIRRIYLYFVGRYDNVDVLDIQAKVFGTQCVSSHPLMTDQLHPSPGLSSDVNGLVPCGGGYVAIADAIAERVGAPRSGLIANGSQRNRTDLIVYSGPSAGIIRLLNRDHYAVPATQASILVGDSLYVNGMDSPISLAAATVDRLYSPTILQISGLGATDFSGAVGKVATVAGNHPPMTTQDRQTIYVDLASVAAGATVTVDITVSGVKSSVFEATGVLVSPHVGFAGSGLLLLSYYVVAADTVRLIIQNPTGSAIDRPGESWIVWVVR